MVELIELKLKNMQMLHDLVELKLKNMQLLHAIQQQTSNDFYYVFSFRFTVL